MKNLHGIVTFSARQSRTSFDSGRKDLKQLGITFELQKFYEKPRLSPIRSVIADLFLLRAVLRRPYDFIILNSGASLLLRPLLLRTILSLTRIRHVALFVLWRNAAEKFDKIARRIGQRRLTRLTRVLSGSRLRHLAISKKTAEDVASVLCHVSVSCIGNSRRMPPGYDSPVAPDDPPIVLNVASVQRRKRPDLFVETAARVCSEHPTAKFHWVGGRSTPSIDRRIRRYGLEGRVVFEGFVSPPYEWMSRASAFFLTSESEGFGLVLAEAMACYRTALCFAETGAASVVGKDGGFVIPRFDVDRAARVILALIDQPPFKRISYQARARYESTFAPGAYARVLSRALRAGTQRDISAE